MEHHGAALRQLTGDQTLVDGLRSDWRSVELDAAEAAMCGYAAKLTAEIESMNEGDIESLRMAGFDDSAILDINLITAYFNFVNRIAEGLGVELEPERVGSGT